MKRQNIALLTILTAMSGYLILHTMAGRLPLIM